MARRKSAEPVAYKPPSAREMLRMDAERMAKDAILSSPGMKKQIARTAREIMRAASGHGGGGRKPVTRFHSS